MQAPRRVAWLVLLLGLGLFLGVLFRDFLLANFILPIALLAMLLWRVVQSVHQAFYWGVMLAIAAGVATFRLAQTIMPTEETVPPDRPAILKSVSYWQTALLITGVEGWAAAMLRRDLGRILVAIYASQQPEAWPAELHEALKQHRLPLPPAVHTFLFPSEASKTEPAWRRRLRRLAETPSRWFRQSTGRDRAEYFQGLEETVAFMETLMEIEHGADDFTSNH